MKIGWLADIPAGYIGGAELSSDALLATAPQGLKIIFCPSHKRPPPDIDAWIIQNCVTYDRRWIEALSGKRAIKQVRDYWPHGDAVFRRWLLDNATCLIFSSQPHLDHFGYPLNPPIELVPPPIERRFVDTANEFMDRPLDTVWLGRLFDGKGVGRALDWAIRHNVNLHFYGPGPYAEMIQEPAEYRGILEYSEVADTLKSYRRFVFFPEIVEPFGRAAAEAFLSGCEMIVNPTYIGAYWWIERDPVALMEGARMFWEIVEEYLK